MAISNSESLYILIDIGVAGSKKCILQHSKCVPLLKNSIIFMEHLIRGYSS